MNEQLGEIEDAAIYIQGNVITWVGKDCDIPLEFMQADEVVDSSNHIVIPGDERSSMLLSLPSALSTF